MVIYNKNAKMCHICWDTPQAEDSDYCESCKKTKEIQRPELDKINKEYGLKLTSSKPPKIELKPDLQLDPPKRRGRKADPGRDAIKLENFNGLFARRYEAVMDNLRKLENLFGPAYRWEPEAILVYFENMHKRIDEIKEKANEKR